MEGNTEARDKVLRANPASFSFCCADLCALAEAWTAGRFATFLGDTAEQRAELRLPSSAAPRDQRSVLLVLHLEHIGQACMLCDIFEQCFILAGRSSGTGQWLCIGVLLECSEFYSARAKPLTLKGAWGSTPACATTHDMPQSTKEPQASPPPRGSGIVLPGRRRPSPRPSTAASSCRTCRRSPRTAASTTLRIHCRAKTP